MSTDPNTLIVLQLTPNNGEDPYEVFSRIIKDLSLDEDDAAISIDNKNYQIKVIGEEGYDENYQISSDPNTIILHTYITHGYGSTIDWSELEKINNSLEVWSAIIKTKYNCSSKIYITANYW